MCNVQKVIVVEKDITSIANFANWGGGEYPTCRSHCPCGGGGGRQYLHVHIFIYGVRRWKRSAGTPPF